LIFNIESSWANLLFFSLNDDIITVLLKLRIRRKKITIKNNAFDGAKTPAIFPINFTIFIFRNLASGIRILPMSM
jgi:hypothetical protein